MLTYGSQEFRIAVYRFQNDPLYHTIVDMFGSLLRQKSLATKADIISAFELAEFQAEMDKREWTESWSIYKTDGSPSIHGCGKPGCARDGIKENYEKDNSGTMGKE